MSIKKSFTVLLVVAMALAFGQYAAAQTGTWKDYMAYYEVQDVKKGGNMLYVLASNNLYTYNSSDNSIQTYDKINGLSDCNIDKIEWNNSVRKLLIVYDDYNLDIMDEKGNVTNLSDYINSSFSGDKTINDIYMNGRYAYLSTGFGIVKIDLTNNVVSDTYNLRFNVNYCYIEGNSIFAASSSRGLYSASLQSNLLDPGQWSRAGNYTRKTYTVDPELLATARAHIPDGPKYNHFGFIRFKYGSLYTVCGGFVPGGADLHYPGTVQVLDPSTDTWTIYEDSLQKKTGYIYECTLGVDVDPTDHSHVMATGRCGMYEFRDGKFVRLWNSANSEIRDAVNVNYTLILGGAYDNEGNFWFANSQALHQNLWEYTHDGQLVNKSTPVFYHPGTEGSLAGIKGFFFDRDANMWFFSESFTLPATCYYQPSTGGGYLYSTYENEDGTTYTDVTYIHCIDQDRDGNIWIGTSIGPFYIRYQDITTPPDQMIFQQYKVPRNDGTDLADYLLSGANITCMAIDGGNRKWFGTQGDGVYLISADNNTEIHHFLSTNSGLLSNDVQSIAINPSSGEVFIGTVNGLCSYMGDATEPVETMDKDVTYAYPNPVKPDYTGPITITGLSFNADVKIVTSNGVLVAQGRSNGGTFIWDGRDLNGKRVASGVYMVQTATESGDKGTVCKIAVVN